MRRKERRGGQLGHERSVHQGCQGRVPVGPGQGQTLAFVLHSPVLKPNLNVKREKQKSELIFNIKIFVWQIFYKIWG